MYIGDIHERPLLFTENTVVTIEIASDSKWEINTRRGYKFSIHTCMSDHNSC